MQLLFKERFFSWFDSYDIYNENGETVYTVEGKLSWGHRLEVSDYTGRTIAEVQERVLTFLPKFELSIEGQDVGCLTKEFTFFMPVFTLDCNGWQIEGDWMEWDYTVIAPNGELIMQASKQLLNWTDTYVLDIPNPANGLLCLMIVLAIDAAKCSKD